MRITFYNEDQKVVACVDTVSIPPLGSLYVDGETVYVVDRVVLGTTKLVLSVTVQLKLKVEPKPPTMAQVAQATLVGVAIGRNPEIEGEFLEIDRLRSQLLGRTAEVPGGEGKWTHKQMHGFRQGAFLEAAQVCERMAESGEGNINDAVVVIRRLADVSVLTPSDSPTGDELHRAYPRTMEAIGRGSSGPEVLPPDPLLPQDSSPEPPQERQVRELALRVDQLTKQVASLVDIVRSIDRHTRPVIGAGPG